MYLKELTLKGFKSFASATTLRFEPGITAVVGPNGSGKSNIVDALTWVMGEQGARNLRGSTMEDVIFAGTSKRPPLGRAQVSLTIDNADHTLNIDYSEVTITRTIFRNGGSQYAINGSACRLLDIQELLSDTGLGQQMHVIVGQGRLDSILRADPSGHRAFIEEAAGILKHRKRKERALRKLSNTQTNLSRLDDLLRELHRQLGPLGRQARISRRAERIQLSLRDAQSRLYAQDASELTARRERLKTELTQVRSRLGDMQADLARVKVRIDQVEALSSRSSPDMAAINQTWHDMSQIQERLRAVSSLAQERSRSLRGQITTNAGEDPDLLAKRAAELELQATVQERTVSDARLRLDRAVESRAGTEKQLASVRQTLTELRKTNQKRESRISQLKELIAREEGAVQLARTRMKDFHAQRTDVAARTQEAKERCEELERQMDADPDDGGASLENARTVLRTRQNELDDLLARQRDVDSRIISLRAKADALRDTLGSRNATGALQKDENVAALGRLSDFIRVSEGWEEAVAHALGSFASAIIVPGRDTMLHALETACSQHLGRAVVLHPIQGDPIAPDAPSGSVGALVHGNPQADDPEQVRRVVAAVRLLLGSIAAVRDRNDAVEAVKGGMWRAAVTQAGELINPVGAIGGSSLSQSDLSLAARRDKALAKVESLRSQALDLARQVEESTAVRDRQKSSVELQTTRRTEAAMKARQREDLLRSAKKTLETLARQESAVADRLRGAEEDGDSHTLRVNDLKTALRTQETNGETEINFDELTGRERGLEAQLNATREREMGEKVAWSTANGTLDSLRRQVSLLRDNAERARQRRERIQALNDRRTRQADRIDRVASDAAAVSRIVGHVIVTIDERRETMQQEASSHDDELKDLRGRRDGIEPVLADLQRHEHELDVRRERLAASYGQLTQRISDDLAMSVEELVANYGPDRPVPVLDDDGRPVPLENGGHERDDGQEGSGGHPGEYGEDDETLSRIRTMPYVRSEQQSRLEKARRDLKALGRVNPLATEEYDALQERNQYLNDQRNDVAKGRDDLMQLIKDLDSTMVQVFSDAFDDTAHAFEHVFSTLFPGGTGRLRLENPDDMLTTGVIVEASPAGKRVKQLSLLSGGERSLTALALLFAIFTARPSPFYVMDEVEAALDDVNLTRLIHAFDELRRHAQLIIITHQQRTMGIADALYGVTMRADGVTAVLSQRLDREGVGDDGAGASNER